MPEAQQHKDSPPTLYTVREVAALTIYRMVARGTIGGVQFGPRSTVRLPRHELEQLLTRSPIATAGGATGVSSPRSRGLEDGGA